MEYSGEAGSDNYVVTISLSIGLHRQPSYNAEQFWSRYYLNSFNLIPAWMSNHMSSRVWDEISEPLPNFHRWSLEMDKLFHIELYNGWNYVSMPGLKLINVSKRGLLESLLLTY